MLARMSVTLTDTNWARYTAASLTPLGGLAVPVAGWRIRSLEVVSVGTNTCSIFFGERVGNSDGGTRGMIFIPEATAFPSLDNSTLTLGTLAVRFVHAGSSSGTTVSTFGKTRSQVVAEVVALITAASTGIGDLEDVAAVEAGGIVLQSDASDVSVPTWTKGVKADGVKVAAPLGLTAATAQTIAAGATMAKRTFADYDDVRAFSLRANTANSVVLVEAELQPAGWPLR